MKYLRILNQHKQMTNSWQILSYHIEYAARSIATKKCVLCFLWDTANKQNRLQKKKKKTARKAAASSNEIEKVASYYYLSFVARVHPFKPIKLLHPLFRKVFISFVVLNDHIGTVSPRCTHHTSSWM